MGTTSGPSFLLEDGLRYGMPSGASRALHPNTPFGNPPVIQTTVEAKLLAQMISLQQETQNIQPSQSLQTPGRQKKGKKGTKATLAPSKQLVVLAPRDQPHVPKKVYTDCPYRLNDMDAERQRSPVRVNAHLRDSRMRVIGDKLPLIKVQGLGSEAESDDEYAPSKGIESHYCSETPTEYSKARAPSPRRTSEDYISEEIPSRDPAIRLLFQRIQKMEDDRTRFQEPD
ncbi:unnamed protein product [Prunus armeniaca]